MPTLELIAIVEMVAIFSGLAYCTFRFGVSNDEIEDEEIEAQPTAMIVPLRPQAVEDLAA